jgi:hypothetical protein
MNTEKGANHCQQNCDPLDEDKDFTLGVESSHPADLAAHRDCFCGGSRSCCSKSPRAGALDTLRLPRQQGTIGHAPNKSRMPRL